jgi:hypothetical protein
MTAGYFCPFYTTLFSTSAVQLIGYVPKLNPRFSLGSPKTCDQRRRDDNHRFLVLTTRYTIENLQFGPFKLTFPHPHCNRGLKHEEKAQGTQENVVMKAGSTLQIFWAERVFTALYIVENKKK